MVLTCLDCNSRVFSQIDSHLAKHLKFRQLARSVLSSRERGKGAVLLSIDGRSVNAHLESEGNHLHFCVDIRHNGVKRISAFRSAALEQDSASFKVSHSSKFSRRKAQLAYLKSAYLLAFAKFGYSYALGDNTTLLRSQLRLSDKVYYPLRFVDAQDDDPGIYLAKDQSFMLVCLLGRTIVLPGIDGSEQRPDFPPVGISMRYSFFDLPKRFEAMIDFGPSPAELKFLPDQ